MTFLAAFWTLKYWILGLWGPYHLATTLLAHFKALKEEREQVYRNKIVSERNSKPQSNDVIGCSAPQFTGPMPIVTSSDIQFMLQKGSAETIVAELVQIYSGLIGAIEAHLAGSSPIIEAVYVGSGILCMFVSEAEKQSGPMKFGEVSGFEAMLRLSQHKETREDLDRIVRCKNGLGRAIIQYVSYGYFKTAAESVDDSFEAWLDQDASGRMSA